MQDNVYITRPSILLTYIVKYKPVNSSEFFLLMAVSAILYDHHNDCMLIMKDLGLIFR